VDQPQKACDSAKDSHRPMLRSIPADEHLTLLKHAKHRRYAAEQPRLKDAQHPKAWVVSQQIPQL
jgi:hypothetical protein